MLFDTYFDFVHQVLGCLVKLLLLAFNIFNVLLVEPPLDSIVGRSLYESSVIDIS
jgi:hypothetical protein